MLPQQTKESAKRSSFDGNMVISLLTLFWLTIDPFDRMIAFERSKKDQKFKDRLLKVH